MQLDFNKLHNYSAATTGYKLGGRGTSRLNSRIYSLKVLNCPLKFFSVKEINNRAF